ALRLLHQNQNAAGPHTSLLHLFLPSLIGMVFSFAAGLLALKWLSRWLESGKWMYFGVYCIAAAGGILLIHAKVQ
ncbi:MAG TPA: undecaprenyl-diphosphate phosphatase, partial [Pseudomonadales bacterium]|nr:undecaprenyl-diphosphate phosphatase [Pseudomonadales bacterium]